MDNNKHNNYSNKELANNTSDGNIPNESDFYVIESKLKPLSTAWIPEALILDTQEVWSKVYEREISKEEATEILLNIKRLAKFLSKYGKEL